LTIGKTGKVGISLAPSFLQTDVSCFRKVQLPLSKNEKGATVSVPKSIGSGGGIKAVAGELEKIVWVARKTKGKEKNWVLPV
jgi:hypothetical protein